MALTPTDESHALQIQAGIIGRKSGHAFEDQIAHEINTISYPTEIGKVPQTHLATGSPARILLDYIASIYRESAIEHATAISTGALATSEKGKNWLNVNGITVKRCKSDVIVTLRFQYSQSERTIAVSTKQCNAIRPTNAQFYFSTARGFSKLLTENGIHVTEGAIEALQQFCGDPGFRPSDSPSLLKDRLIDPRRYFWEELAPGTQLEWEQIFSIRQDEITKLLLQKAYLADPFTPDILLHKTKRSESWGTSEVAVYTIDELVRYSREYAGFVLRPYRVRKGSYKDPIGVEHLAPRFGIVQMQRGGQAQHPEQLQFNLEAGYFYKIQNVRSHVFGDHPS